MVIIPAIDMLGGECVRLTQGDYNQVTVYEKDPVAVAREFEAAGAKRIHLVDLDAARGVKHVNRKKIRKIRKAVSCVLEVGGGVRRDEDIEELLDLGVDRLVVGTVFAKNPGLVEGWVHHYGEVFIAGIDAKDGRVKTSGWTEDSSIIDVDLAKKAAECGICSIIYTNISRDGMLSGPDIEATNKIARESGVPVILSGGISKEEDFAEIVDKGDKGIVGVIAGKAIYENSFDLPRVLEKYNEPLKGDEVW